MKYQTNIDLYKILDVADMVESRLLKEPINISSLSIVSAIAGVFSGFSKHVKRVSKEFSVDPRDVFMELGRQKIVAGQEDTIIDIAMKLQKRN